MREPISFFQEDLDDVKYPHDDVVVVSTMIGNAKVHRLLVTTGSSYEILFISAFIRDKPDEAGEPHRAPREIHWTFSPDSRGNRLAMTLGDQILSRKAQVHL